mmetsp:Transcript_18256/g.27231  ORF Transcript_18256/g.27231 Transcript_18256/m.27231 type:complete len:83 (+) Transcript_18256:574-822(+)
MKNKWMKIVRMKSLCWRKNQIIVKVTMKDQGSNNSFVNSTALLPFERPELRVDLPSLVVPPLMTSWLPSAESIDTSYRDEQR